jgi:hypothetical protein
MEGAAHRTVNQFGADLAVARRCHQESGARVSRVADTEAPVGLFPLRSKMCTRRSCEHSSLLWWLGRVIVR